MDQMWRIVNQDWRVGGGWRKSTYSNDLSCVYVRRDHGAVRDSKDAGGAPLPVSPVALAALVRSVTA